MVFEQVFESLKLSSLKQEIKSSGLSIPPLPTPCEQGKCLHFSFFRCQTKLSW